MKYWLFKSEPSSFSIDDLARSPSQTTLWTGVRNYQARNLLRDSIQAGDEVLFYHSSARLLGIAGFCQIIGQAIPDATAFDHASEYYDPKSTKDNPRWWAVPVQLRRRLARMLPLAVLKQTVGLEHMMVCRRGARLSIQPVAPKEWEIIQRVARNYE